VVVAKCGVVLTASMPMWENGPGFLGNPEFISSDLLSPGVAVKADPGDVDTLTDGKPLDDGGQPAPRPTLLPLHHLKYLSGQESGVSQARPRQGSPPASAAWQRRGCGAA